MRNIMTVLVVSTGVMFAQIVAAHTPLQASIPAADAVLDAAPQEIVLEFPHAVRLTAVVLEDAAGAAKRVGAIPTEPAAKFTVSVADALPAGSYEIAWRAVGADTHVISGTIEFSIKPQRAH